MSGVKDDLIKRMYFEAFQPYGLSSQDKLYKACKEIDGSISRHDIKRVLSSVDIYTQHYPVRKRYPVNSMRANRLDEIWQIDLSDVSHLSSYNKGYKYLFFAIDVFSRYLWVRPLLNKKARSAAQALTSIFHQDNRVPGYISSDQGSEFLGNDFDIMLKRYGIGYFNHTSIHKAAIVERVQRTFKTKLTKYFQLTHSYEYVDVLNDLVMSYNHSFHRSLQQKPYDVAMRDHKPTSLKRCETLGGERGCLSSKLKVGDHVRISKTKKIFEKGYEQGWTTEVFKINKVIKPKDKRDCLIMYQIADLRGEIIVGRFYYHELQRVSYDAQEVFDIERVIKRYKNKRGQKVALVKWLGWDNRFNSEVLIKDLKYFN